MKRAFGLALGAALIVAACGSVDVSSGQPSKSPPSPSTAATVAAETASPASTPPSSDVLPTDALPSPSPSQDVASGAAGCSGSAGNRDFFAAVAEAVTWSVYCAVVPDGWFLESGNYRLRAGGQMTVAYRGPGGLHLELREGAFCNDANGCVPDGQATGPAPFGDLAGTLYVLSGGGLAVVVDRGETISWLAIGGNLDEPTFRSLTAALHRVD